jgi:lipoyl(octanoyl) transferase
MIPLQYTDLGLMPYPEALTLQREAADALARADAAGRVLLVEHPHVFTLGKHGNEGNLLASGVELLKVDRGGDITYHGPGQLVVYPIINLHLLGAGIREYVNGLEEIVIRVIARHGIAGDRLSGATGVWIDPPGARPRKICAIGIKCSRGITTHGLALNVNTDLSYFSRIHPCGFRDKGVTSMAAELGREIPMPGIKAAITEEFEARWGTAPATT